MPHRDDFIFCLIVYAFFALNGSNGVLCGFCGAVRFAVSATKKQKKREFNSLYLLSPIYKMCCGLCLIIQWL